MMVLLILPKESIKNDNIDVYLQLLVEELKTLWERVNTIDVTRPKGSNSFFLRAICMWSIHDFPVYGLFLGSQVKGTWHAPFMVQMWIFGVPST
jgi:hypothetical protein